ncbi:S24 family peptidase [Sphingomonas radiodurans]|uniref:S24 family peptidase n=1 Tax=Sphingomonas radiodurans TaxID=2890321 RepID=UPI001E51658B|nr:S24 family peptidase [Sphingomonas radiodurans]WBH17253.1 S24 family peptidase [Sphingomonas radiodurans]
MRTVGETLEALAAARGVSLSELSRLLGRNVAYLQQFVRRGTPRRLDERDRATLAQFFGVEEALLGGAARAAEVVVPYLSVAASAGRGRVAEDERLVRAEHFTARMLREAGVAPGAASIIDAVGDSMAPGILPGDRLLVDGGDVSGAGVCVVRRGEELLVKRVRREGEAIVLVSDNPAYPPLVCGADEVVVIGRVRLLLRRP